MKDSTRSPHRTNALPKMFSLFRSTDQITINDITEYGINTTEEFEQEVVSLVEPSSLGSSSSGSSNQIPLMHGGKQFKLIKDPPLIQSSDNEAALDVLFMPEDVSSTSATAVSYRSFTQKACDHRVLIYTTCYNVIDGVTLTIRKLEQEILSAGGRVCILTTRSGDPANTNLDGEHPNRRILFLDDAIQIPFASDPSSPGSVYYIGFSLSKEMRNELDDFSPTLVHITVPDIVSLDIIQYARDNELPLMGTFHSNYVDYLDHYGLFWIKPCLLSFFRHQYGFYQALYCPTPFIQGTLESEEKRFDRCTNIQVWGRGIDLELFSPEQRSHYFRERVGFSPTDVVICFVGRFVFEKRPDIFAYVIRRLVAQNMPYKALCIGCGPYEEELRSLPNTVCTGWLNGEELATAYASSDIFLFPSALETFGNVTLEAAASGLPLVVEAGCSGHLVIDGANGFGCPEGDEECFYQATLELLTNHALREQFAIESRKHSCNFEKGAIMCRMLKNYEDVTDEFYSKHKGQHAERDASLRHTRPEAFSMGMVERPCLLRMFISCFVFVIQTAFFLYMQFGCLWICFSGALASVRQMGGTVNVLNSNRESGGIEQNIKQNGKKVSSATSISSPEMVPWKGISCVYRISEMVVMLFIVFLRIQACVEYTIRNHLKSRSRAQSKRKDTGAEDDMGYFRDIHSTRHDSIRRRISMVNADEVAQTIAV